MPLSARDSLGRTKQSTEPILESVFSGSSLAAFATISRSGFSTASPPWTFSVDPTLLSHVSTRRVPFGEGLRASHPTKGGILELEKLIKPTTTGAPTPPTHTISNLKSNSSPGPLYQVPRPNPALAIEDPRACSPQTLLSFWLHRCPVSTCEPRDCATQNSRLYCASHGYGLL